MPNMTSIVLLFSLGRPKNGCAILLQYYIAIFVIVIVYYLMLIVSLVIFISVSIVHFIYVVKTINYVTILLNRIIKL